MKAATVAHDVCEGTLLREKEISGLRTAITAATAALAPYAPDLTSPEESEAPAPDEVEVTTADLSPELQRQVADLAKQTTVTARRILTEALDLAQQFEATEAALIAEHGPAVNWNARFTNVPINDTRAVMHQVGIAIDLDGGQNPIRRLLDELS